MVLLVALAIFLNFYAGEGAKAIQNFDVNVEKTGQYAGKGKLIR